ncbi:Hypothetical_protein [Hexamita inflata]|nr:Hypothetical protein HINF_LOCUS36553 [Hexamita inflata]
MKGTRVELNIWSKAQRAGSKFNYIFCDVSRTQYLGSYFLEVERFPKVEAPIIVLQVSTCYFACQGALKTRDSESSYQFEQFCCLLIQVFSGLPTRLAPKQISIRSRLSQDSLTGSFVPKVYFSTNQYLQQITSESIMLVQVPNYLGCLRELFRVTIPEDEV